jgi:CheY-like chemotaxis protein
VLVVDDQIRFATLLPRLLPRHAVVFEQTGEAALSRLAAGERFDVLVCDVMMPGMDGPTLHARLVETEPELASRTLFVTGGAFEGGARAYLRDVGQPVLGKPYERRALVEAIDALVAAADAGPAR